MSLCSCQEACAGSGAPLSQSLALGVLFELHTFPLTYFLPTFLPFSLVWPVLGCREILTHVLRFDVQPLVVLTYLGLPQSWRSPFPVGWELNCGDGFHGVCFAMLLGSDLCVVGLGAVSAFPDRGNFSGTEHQQS